MSVLAIATVSNVIGDQGIPTQATILITYAPTNSLPVYGQQQFQFGPFTPTLDTADLQSQMQAAVLANLQSLGATVAGGDTVLFI